MNRLLVVSIYDRVVVVQIVFILMKKTWSVSFDFVRRPLVVQLSGCTVHFKRGKPLVIILCNTFQFYQEAVLVMFFFTLFSDPYPWPSYRLTWNLFRSSSVGIFLPLKSIKFGFLLRWENHFSTRRKTSQSINSSQDTYGFNCGIEKRAMATLFNSSLIIMSPLYHPFLYFLDFMHS